MAPPPSSLLGRIQAVESSKLFQTAVISIIVLSALTIGARTYELPAGIDQSLGYLDAAVTLFFLVEILLRFAAHPNKKRFFADGWNVFDTLVVVGSLIPLDQAESVLLGRLLRVFRMLRLVSVVPELRFLIDSLLIAIPRMGYIALLMFIIFYIYGTIGSLFFQDINPVLWGDVAIAMLTLFRVATFEDWTDVMYETMSVHPLSWIYYLSFIFLTAFVFLNMMVGAILEVMGSERQRRDAENNQAAVDQAHHEREQMAAQITAMQIQMSEMHELLKSRAPGAAVSSP
ncbi:MAG: ion transporter [Lysobacterales bacterium]